MIVLKAIDLAKKYAGASEYAVNEFNANILKGDIVALLGESGCGKTTILRMIAGFEKPDKGLLQLSGRDIASNDFMIPPEKRSVGIVFQDYALFPHKTVKENILYGLFRLDKAMAENRLAEMLSLTALGGLEKRYPHELSGGQQQRVAIARALAPDPGILLLDEPFSNIDAMRKNELRYELREILKKAGTTSVFVTHDTRDVMAIADKVFVLKNGETIQQGKPEEIFKMPADSYVALFFGKTNILSIETMVEVLTKCFRLQIPNPEASEKLISIRPAAIKVFDKPTENTCEACMTAQKYFGEYNELSVDIGPQKTELIVHVNPGFIPESNKLWLRIKQEDMIFLKK